MGGNIIMKFDFFSLSQIHMDTIIGTPNYK